MSRLSYALLGALALHGLALLVRARHVPDAALSGKLQTLEQQVELEEAPPEEPNAPPLANEAEPASSHAAPASAIPQSALRSAKMDSPQSANSEGESNLAAPSAADSSPGVAAPAGSAQASNEAPARKIDLGLDGTFFMHPATEIGPRAHKSAAQRSLEASLAANDVQHGMARGNALLSSLNAAARESGPLRGEALLRVTVGPDGSFSEVELVQGAASDWTAVLRSFRELATRKRLRVPPGARGLRVSFSVKAKVQRPSGKEADAFPVGVTDPSLKPNGLTLRGDFDVADLAGGSQRMVYARVVSEEVL